MVKRRRHNAYTKGATDHSSLVMQARAHWPDAMATRSMREAHT